MSEKTIEQWRQEALSLGRRLRTRSLSPSSKEFISWCLSATEVLGQEPLWELLGGVGEQLDREES